MSYQPMVVENKTTGTSVVADSAITGVHLVTCLTPTGLNGTKSAAEPAVEKSYSLAVSSTSRAPSSEHSGEQQKHNIKAMPSAQQGLAQSNELQTKGNISASGFISSSSITSTALLTSPTITTTVLANPVTHVGSFELAGMEHLAHHHYLPDKQYSTANVPPHMHLSCDILSCPHHVQGSHQTMELPVVAPVHDYSHRETYLPREKGVDTEQNKDSIAMKNKHGRITGRNEIKKTRSKRSHRQDTQLSRLTSEERDYVPKDVKKENMAMELRDFHQRESTSDESTKPRRTKMVGNIIGQVPMQLNLFNI